MLRIDRTRHGAIRTSRTLIVLFLLLALAPIARAAEHITLRNGFEFTCIRRELQGDKVRLFFEPATPDAEQNYLDVVATSVIRVETIPDPPHTTLAAATAPTPALQPTLAELHELLSRAGAEHHIDVDLLASLVHAESGGRSKAVSRTGARGLMQLMPATAVALGVKDSFLARENVDGGTRYLDLLLTRYHDNIAFALAAYNAGPAAVDRYHGVPPYRETRTYVAQIVREFNRRKSILVVRSQ